MLLLQFSTINNDSTCGCFLGVNIPYDMQNESGFILQQWFSEHSPRGSIHEHWNLVEMEILRTYVDLLNLKLEVGLLGLIYLSVGSGDEKYIPFHRSGGGGV